MTTPDDSRTVRAAIELLWFDPEDGFQELFARLDLEHAEPDVLADLRRYFGGN